MKESINIFHLLELDPFVDDPFHLLEPIIHLDDPSVVLCLILELLPSPRIAFCTASPLASNFRLFSETLGSVAPDGLLALDALAGTDTTSNFCLFSAAYWARRSLSCVCV